MNEQLTQEEVNQTLSNLTRIMARLYDIAEMQHMAQGKEEYPGRWRYCQPDAWEIGFDTDLATLDEIELIGRIGDDTYHHTIPVQFLYDEAALQSYLQEHKTQQKQAKERAKERRRSQELEQLAALKAKYES